MRVTSLPVLCLIAAVLPVFGAETAPTAEVRVDAAVTVNTFRPVNVFGVNMVPYVDKAGFANIQAKQQAAGTVLARYPGGIADDFHWYPFYMNDNRQSTWNTVTQLTALPARMDEWLAHHPRRSAVPLLLSEFNSGAGTPFSTSIENALWLANTLGEYIRGFGSRGMASYWTVLHPADASSNPAGGDQSFFQLETNRWQYQERPVYWTMKLMSAHWAIPGDDATHKLVQANSDNPQLPVYADLRPDNVLSLLVVNRNLEEACRTRLELGGFVPAEEAKRWTFDASNYSWSTNSAPYHADPDQAPQAATQAGIGPSFEHTFPPGSITVFQFTKKK